MATFKIGKVVLGSLFKKPSTKITASQPIITKDWKERTRGHVEIDVDECILCGMCMRKCPANAITVDRAGSSWEIQRMQCIQCNCCVEACPKKCLSMAPEYTEPGTEKVVSKFDIPQKEKPAPKAAPAKAEKPAEDKPAEAAEAPAQAPAADGPDGITVNMDDCVLCGLCAKNCPVSAITVDRKETKSWEIDRDACIQCQACVGACPKNALDFGPTSGDRFVKA